MRITEFPILSEVKEEYIKLRQSGNSRTSSTQNLIEVYRNELSHGAKDDGLLFWIALADAQYYHKELAAEVAQKAIEAIDIIAACDWKVCSGDLERRKDNYFKAPMPERKLGKPRPKYRCTWKNGDTFAYQITGVEAEKLNIAGQYALLRKVADEEYYDGRLIPVVSISIWEKEPLPSTEVEFAYSSLLKLQSGRFFTPRSKYEYRTELVIKSKKQLDQIPLIYLGNFPDLKMPDNEIVFTKPGHKLIALLENLDSELCVFWKNNNQYDAQGKQGRT